MPMMAITTNNSTSVKPFLGRNISTVDLVPEAPQQCLVIHLGRLAQEMGAQQRHN